MEVEFQTSIAGKVSDVSRDMLDLSRDMNDQMELLGARGEIAQTENSTLPGQIRMRMLNNAARRIQKILAENTVSTKARIRGLADLAYARKRLGDHEGALAAVLEARDLQPEGSTSTPLLTYNAACYSSLLNKPDACTLLVSAIALNADYKVSARTEPDFDNIKHMPEFEAALA